MQIGGSSSRKEESPQSANTIVSAISVLDVLADYFD